MMSAPLPHDTGRPRGEPVVGIGWRHPHYAELLEARPALDFIEVHSENFFAAGGAALAVLREGRTRYPVSLHGVGLSLGSAIGIDEWHLDQLARLVQEIDPVRVSDHASFARGAMDGGGFAVQVHAADLLPVPFSHEALEVMCANVQRVQDRLQRPIAVENLSAYLRWRDAAMSETEFLATLARRTGCSLLVDVNNIYVNALNAQLQGETGEPVAVCRQWLDEMASSPVAEIHLAGHVHCGDIVIDDHGSRVCADVWTLYRHAIARFGAVPTLIEWDTDVPPLAVLLDEAKRARATATAALQPVHAGGLRRTPLAQDVAGNHTPVCPEELGCDARRKTRRWANPTSGLQRRSAPKSDGANGESYFLPHPPQQVLLGALLAVPRSPLAASARAALANEVLTPWERGLNAYQANGHDSAKRSLLAAYPVVAALIGDDSFALMAREFWHRHPPVRGDLACWGEALSGFVAANLQLADVPYLADVARVEWALHRAAGAPDATADLASFALVTRADPDTLTLQLPPGTVVVISEWPVASLVTAHGVGEPSMEVAAARVQTRQGECAVVWRQGLRPRVAPCTHAAAALLQALVRGCSLPASLNDALEADPDFDLGPWLNAAVADGLVLGASPLPRPGEAISLAAPLAA